MCQNMSTNKYVSFLRRSKVYFHGKMYSYVVMSYFKTRK